LNKDLHKFNQQTSGNQKKNKALLQNLIKLDRKEVDSLFQEAHEEVFACTDCLKCANCCKTTGPLFTSSDIKRISSKLKLSEKEFVQKYLRKDEDNDMVLQKVPCTFLGEDNHCSIYEFRPKACREYPHTDQKDQPSIYHLTLKNASVCPAVSDILEHIRAKIG
jgi:Fe-S-cluster containining protein